MLPMNSSSRFLILLTLPPIVSLGVGAKWAATRARASQVQTQEIEVIDAPDRWVPFSADVTIKTHGTDVVGRFYRAADGSRRIETGPARDDIRVISIVNTSKGNGYDYSPGRGWRVFLVPNISPGNYHPVRWKKNIPGWSIYPYRLAVRQGQSGSLMAAEGFLAYEVKSPDGTVKLKVPELNLFDVVTRRADGHEEVYSNIDLNEPPVELFRPPGDVVVTEAPPKVRR